jgi:hypothetical protein
VLFYATKFRIICYSEDKKRIHEAIDCFRVAADKKERPDLKDYEGGGQAQWLTPVIPVTQEV